MKRVFIVSPTESVLTKRGKRHPKLADYLTVKGYQVKYISTTYNHGDRELFSIDEIEHSKKIIKYECVFIDIGGYFRNVSLKRVLWDFRIGLAAYKYLINRMKAEDVLIIPSRPPELIFYAAKLKRKLSINLVLDIEDIWPDAFMVGNRIRNKLLSYLFYRYCDVFQRKSIAKFDSFVHVAPSFMPWLHKYSGNTNSEFLPLGFDEARWASCEVKNTRKMNIPISLIYCGALTYGLNIMPVIMALRDRQNTFSLTLIGDNGKGEKYYEAIEYINKNSMKNIRVFGRIPAESVVKEYQKHDISIIPMISGALPNKVWDSIASYLPMLSLGKGDSSDLVSMYDIGWVADFDANSVGSALDNITFEDIVKKSHNILEIRDNYSHSAVFTKYEKVISSLFEDKL